MVSTSSLTAPNLQSMLTGSLCSMPIPLGMVIRQGGCRMGGRCPKFPSLPALAWKLHYPSVVISVHEVHGHLDCDISICSFFAVSTLEKAV